jgi:predicted permease
MFRRRRAERERDLDRELQSHLEAEAEDRRERGSTPQQARYEAQRAFGNTTLLKEEVRIMWGWTRFDIFLQDIRYALRTLSKSPGFAITAVLTLAIGIGASTAVFTVIDSVILKPLSYHDSGQLVVAWERVAPLSPDPVGPNPRHVDLWRKRSQAFGGLTLLRHSANGLALGTEHPRLAGTVTCLPNLFDILQVSPSLGRTFISEDGVPGHDHVVILTDALWRNLLGSDPAVIGKTVRIADVPRQVIGVLPAGFQFPNANALRAFAPARQAGAGVPQPAIFVPAVMDLDKFSWNGEYGNWVALGRLAPGVTIQQAETQLTSVEAQIAQEMPGSQRFSTPGALKAFVQPMQDAVVGEAHTALWLLMAAVIGLELIACLNLANAQLGRALSRHREAAVRMALGAAKWRLVWNALAENLVLSVAGGALGVLFAAAGVKAFRLYSPVDLPRLSEVHLNGAVLLFTFALALLSSVISGLIPAFRLLRTDPQLALQQNNSRSLGSRQSHRVSAWLIGLQVFGCTALLLVTGLFSKSLLYLLHQDKGFETGHVAVAEVRLPPKTYDADESRVAFDDAVLRNLRATSGVQTAGLISAMPLDGENWIDSAQRVDQPEQKAPLINLRWASPGYFETLKARLIAGRFLEERDRNLNSAILSEAEAKALWNNDNPLGRQIRIGSGTIFTVVGIVADSHNTSLKTAPVKMVWGHYKDRPPYTTFFVVRGAQSADSLISSMRQAIWQHAPDITIARVKTMDAQLNDSLATERFQTMVLAAFGISALLLAMLGIYGVLSYSVVTRRQEIGVRMALGASRNSIYRLTFREAGAPVIAGLASGLFASILAARVIRNLLYGVQIVDPQVMFAVTGLFLGSAILAALLPARRAASVNPIDTLRAD